MIDLNIFQMKNFFLTSLVKNEKYVLNGGAKIFIDNDISLRLYLIDITKSRRAQETLYTFGLSLSKYI